MFFNGSLTIYFGRKAMEQKSNKSIWAAVAGLLDPELRKAAQNLAEAIPKNSILRTEAVERVLGALKGAIETKAEKLSPAAGVAVEKATDFSDFLAGALGSKNALDPNEMIKEILRGATERIKKAAEPAAEVERIRQEIKSIKEIGELMKQELPPPPPSPTAGMVEVITSWTEKLNAFNTKLEGKVEGMRKWARLAEDASSQRAEAGKRK